MRQLRSARTERRATSPDLFSELAFSPGEVARRSVCRSVLRRRIRFVYAESTKV